MSLRVLKAAGGFARISVKALSSLRNEQLFPHTSLPPGSPDHAHRAGTGIGRGSGRRTRVELAEQGHAVGEAQLAFAAARRLARSRSVPARDTRAACDRLVHRGIINRVWDTDVSGLGFSGTHRVAPCLQQSSRWRRLQASVTGRAHYLGLAFSANANASSLAASAISVSPKRPKRPALV
jgi:hypothetical protein